MARSVKGFAIRLTTNSRCFNEVTLQESPLVLYVKQKRMCSPLKRW